MTTWCSLFLGCAWLAMSCVAAQAAVSPPRVDADKIINDSFSFLKAREPEMTEDEFALYERVIPMAKTRPDFALRLLETMIADEKEESAAFEFALANVYYINDRLDMAERHFRLAIERYPEFQRAWNNLGMVCYVSSRFGDAVDCYGRAIALGDRDAQTYGLLGYALYKTGNPVAAELAYMQAMASDPNNPDWIGAVINMLVENREFARAEPMGRRMVDLRPKEPGSWNLHAGILLSGGRKSDAIATLELATHLGVADADGTALLGDLYYEQGFLSEAAAVYQRLSRLVPEIGVARLLGYIDGTIVAGDLSDAERLLAALAPPAAGEQQVRYLRTRHRLRQAQGKEEDARADLEAILRIAPRDGWTLYTLGDVHRGAGQDVRAEFYYRQVADESEFAYRARLELANICLRRRHYSQAVDYLESALKLEHSPELQRHLVQVRSLISTDETVSR